MFGSLSFIERIRLKRILVTGAGGFIGSRVVEALLNRGATVRALVAAPGEYARVLRSPSLENCRADINDAAALEHLTDEIDVVVHMAGPPSVATSFDEPAVFARIHAAGTATVLSACRKAGVNRFVYVSSAEVYGRPQTSLVSEDHPLAPRSPYGAAKASAEHFVHVFATSFGISSVILRPFSVYGPDSSPASVVATILRMARFEDAVVLNDLAPVRDYCFVEDVADAILRACVVPVAGVATFNIGSGAGVSVGDLAKAVLRVLGRNIPVAERQDRRRPETAEIYTLMADRSRASKILGWEPTTNLESGIRHCI